MSAMNQVQNKDIGQEDFSVDGKNRTIDWCNEQEIVCKIEA